MVLEIIKTSIFETPKRQSVPAKPHIEAVEYAVHPALHFISALQHSVKPYKLRETT